METSLPHQNAQKHPQSFQTILHNIPNTITALRIILNGIILVSRPYLSVPFCSTVLLLCVILDYVDGIAARRFKQCTFFGEIFDWLADIVNYATVLIWCMEVEPHFTPILFGLLVAEITMMLLDVVAKCHNFEVKVE